MKKSPPRESERGHSTRNELVVVRLGRRRTIELFREANFALAGIGRVNPVVASGTVGHKRVELAPEVYDRSSQSEIREALGLVGKQLLPNLLPSGLRN